VETADRLRTGVLDEGPFVSVPRAAEILGVSETTIRRLVYSHQLEAIRVGEGGNWRISASRLAQLVHGFVER
jgi:excisionase family DNA binding protein